MIVLEPGDVFAGRYRLEACIGAGGMGAVWRASQQTLFGRKVALKFILPTVGQDAQHRQLFVGEASVLSRLDHPNICPVLDFGDEAGMLWLAMGYVDGCDLARLIAGSSGGLPIPHAIHVVGQILLALGHAHERGVIHRDLKPSNVLVSRDGDVRITDFGIAKTMAPGQAASTSTFLKGSPGYLAPELLRSAAPSPQSDLFAVGGILFELLTGRNPFIDGPDCERDQILLNTVSKEVPSLASLGVPVPLAIDRAVQAALAKDPARRPASAGHFFEELHGALAELRSPPSPLAWRRYLHAQAAAVVSPPAALVPEPPAASPPAPSSVHVSAMAGQLGGAAPDARKTGGTRPAAKVAVAAVAATVTLLGLALVVGMRRTASSASAPSVTAVTASATPDAGAAPVAPHAIAFDAPAPDARALEAVASASPDAGMEAVAPAPVRPTVHPAAPPARRRHSAPSAAPAPPEPASSPFEVPIGK
jgi:serine/threonine-protein kinase